MPSESYSFDSATIVVDLSGDVAGRGRFKSGEEEKDGKKNAARWIR